MEKKKYHRRKAAKEIVRCNTALDFRRMKILREGELIGSGK